jgi:ATP phosphoribosyltransferase
VEFSWGATEVKAGLVDAIVELTETGRSLRANNLRIIDTVITSTTKLIANNGAWKDNFKREKTKIFQSYSTSNRGTQ